MAPVRTRGEAATTGPNRNRLTNPKEPISSAVSKTAGMTMEKCQEATNA